MEARADVQTLGKHNCPENTVVISGRAFISVCGAPDVFQHETRKKIYETPISSFLGGKNLLFSKTTWCVSPSQPFREMKKILSKTYAC